ncbi:Rossmann-like and DUF2520 domain-containing protein [Thermincola ferriacetica]
MKKVAVVGAGKVGTAMALLLQAKGFEICGIAGRNPTTVQETAKRLGTCGTLVPAQITKIADLIFITTPDRLIEEVCLQIRQDNGFGPGQVVVHMSGAMPAGALGPAKEAGAYVLSVHPLQSFADVEQAIRNLPGSFFALEGDREALPVGMEIVKAVGGEYFLLETKYKPMYHMGAAVASNFLVAVLHWAIKIYQQLGMTQKEAINALWPLVNGSLKNISALGPVQALTGPIARGDLSTLKKHLQALGDYQPENEVLYKVLGLYTARIAREKGSIDDTAYNRMIQLFKGGIN